MRLWIDGKSVPLVGLSTTEHVDKYYSTVDIAVPVRIPDGAEVILEGVNRQRINPITGEFSGDGGYSYGCVCDATIESLNRRSSPIAGLYTPEEAIIGMGYKHQLPQGLTGIPVMWQVAGYRLQYAIQALNRNALFSMGGGAMFYINLNGCISCVDLRFAATGGQQPKHMMGEVQHERISGDYNLSTGNSIMLAYSAGNGLKEQTDNLQGDDRIFGTATYRFADNSGHFAEFVTRKAHNEYYMAMYRYSELTVANVKMPNNDGLSMGDRVWLNGDSNREYTVIGLTIGTPIEGNGGITMAVLTTQKTDGKRASNLDFLE